MRVSCTGRCGFLHVRFCGKVDYGFGAPSALTAGDGLLDMRQQVISDNAVVVPDYGITKWVHGAEEILRTAVRDEPVEHRPEGIEKGAIRGLNMESLVPGNKSAYERLQ